MTKAFVLDWHIPVDKQLLEGEVFDRWSEEEVEEGCRFKVDEHGFFISWKSDGREGEVLDLSQVSWTGKYDWVILSRSMTSGRGLTPRRRRSRIS